MPSAAAVPATTDTSVVSAATFKLVSNVRRHVTSLKNAPHQRSDHASGGNRMKLCALNAAGTIARIGNTRNAATSATKPLSASLPIIERTPALAANAAPPPPEADPIAPWATLRRSLMHARNGADRYEARGNGDDDERR